MWRRSCRPGLPKDAPEAAPRQAGPSTAGTGQIILHEHIMIQQKPNNSPEDELCTASSWRSGRQSAQPPEALSYPALQTGCHLRPLGGRIGVTYHEGLAFRTSRDTGV